MTLSVVRYEGFTPFLMQRTYKLAGADTREKIAAILSLQGVRLAERAYAWSPWITNYVEQNITYANAYNAACMQAEGIAEVYS